MKILDILGEVGISGFLDIIFMSILIYSTLVWFKRTRAIFVVIGMFIVGVVYLMARQLDMSLTTSVFQGFFAIIIIAVVIIFQEEIKHFLEQLASHSVVGRFRGRKLLHMPRKEIDILVNAAKNLARDNIGALIVLRGKDPIVRHLDGGTNLGGEMSEAVLRSIFNPYSPAHDGAVIVFGDQVAQFSTYLPLSKNLRKLQKTGTRHAAALGLSELTDALCVVVSEERGTISVARNGDIHQVKDVEELSSMLEKFYEEIMPSAASKPWIEFFKRNYREKTIAIVVTCLLWFFFVHEARIDHRTFVIPVEYSDVPSQLVVEKVDPAEVELTFAGTRRSFYFLDKDRFKIDLRLANVREGIVRRTIGRTSIDVPEGLTLETIQPNEVRVYLQRKKQ
jgi:diadenylate cyclase